LWLTIRECPICGFSRLALGAGEQPPAWFYDRSLLCKPRANTRGRSTATAQPPTCGDACLAERFGRKNMPVRLTAALQFLPMLE
jgi:hypothetical protein